MLKLQEDQLMVAFDRPKPMACNLAVQALKQIKANDGKSLK